MTTGSSSTHTAWWLTTCHGSPGNEQNVGLHRGAWLRQAWETMDIQAAALDLFKRLKLDAEQGTDWTGKILGKVTGMSRFVSFHSSRQAAGSCHKRDI